MCHSRCPLGIPGPGGVGTTVAVYVTGRPVVIMPVGFTTNVRTSAPSDDVAADESVTPTVWKMCVTGLTAVTVVPPGMAPSASCTVPPTTADVNRPVHVTTCVVTVTAQLNDVSEVAEEATVVRVDDGLAEAGAVADAATPSTHITPIANDPAILRPGSADRALVFHKFPTVRCVLLPRPTKLSTPPGNG
jgi:hypothetical protein